MDFELHRLSARARGRGERPLNGMTATWDKAIEALSAAWNRAKAWSARTELPLA